MTSTFNTATARLSPTHLALPSPSLLPIKHWSQTYHETVLSSNDPNSSIQLPLAGGADNGQFIYINDSLSALKSKITINTLKGGRIDRDEIILRIDQYHIAGFTLVDVQSLIETLWRNEKHIRLKTVKSGLTKDLRQFLDGRFEKDSTDYDLQQTIRDNLYTRTVPCTTRSPRPGEINGQDYTFLSVKDFRALEKNGGLLESGVYKGHYYGTPRPTKGTIVTDTNLKRRSNSANEMLQHFDSQTVHNSKSNESVSPQLSGELITCSLRKSSQGFGFTIVGGYEKGEQFLQVKDILPEGPAAKDGKLRQGDILVYINDSNVLGYGHTDVVKIFQLLSVGDTIHITVCRGYPLSVNFNDPEIDLVSVNGVHHLPNGGYKEYYSEPLVRLYTVKIRKGDQGFGFTVADSPSGQRIKAIVDRQRCQNLCENDLFLSINGQDISGKQHADVVDMLFRCPRDVETTFVVRRGDSDVNNNPLVFDGNNHSERNIQSINRSNISGKHVSFLTSNKENKENDELDVNYFSPKVNERPRSKTPTSFSSAPSVDPPSLRSRTPVPTSTATSNHYPIPNPTETSAPIAQTEFSPDLTRKFDRRTNLSRSARDIRPSNAPVSRSKTPGPEFGATASSYRSNTMKVRSKTPNSHEFPSNTLQNSRSLQSVQPQYSEYIVNLTLLRPSDGFGLRILGGEEEKSQVTIGHIVPSSPADMDGRLRTGDELIKIDSHSTIRATHEKVVHLMQRAKENQHVCLIVRRYAHPSYGNASYRQSNQPNSNTMTWQDSPKKTSGDNGTRYVTLQKTNENQSFGFVIISSQNKAGAIVGKIIPNSPADQCGQLRINDRILAVNGVELSHMLHTDVVNLIKESGRIITLTLGPTVQYTDQSVENQTPSNGIRPSSSTSIVSRHEDNQALRNAYSHNPLNTLEKNPSRPSSRTNGVLKSPSLTDDYFLVDLQRSHRDPNFGFSIRGGREFSIPLFVLKIAENGLAARDGRMKSGDQILEINDRSTYGMTHSEAISLVREGGLFVRLLLRKTNVPPPSLDEVKTAMENGNELPNTSYWKATGYT